ncbi:MAG: hypothetical protein IIY21_21150 [Clostridiales bacterium]|nr:hypothetical protein [Clostridiales bacterium]MBQ1571640.1 hypothetical protein [Clostridiales bacterium]
MKGDDTMDVIQLISSVGFPIVACLGMGWYVKYQTDAYREEVKDMQKEHKEEIQKMSDALNNNTAALQRLCDKLDGGDKA